MRGEEGGQREGGRMQDGYRNTIMNTSSTHKEYVLEGHYYHGML